MVGQPLDLFGQTVGREPFDDLNNACVQRPSPPQQEAPVGHLVGEGVFEGVCRLGEQARLVEELGSL